WLVKNYQSSLDLQTAQGKKAFSDALLPTILRLSDPVEQEHYLKKIADLTDTSLEAIKAKSSHQVGVTPARQRPVKASEETISREEVEYQRFINHLLAIMLFNPKIRDLLKDCPPAYFTNDQSLELYKFLKTSPDFKYGETLP